jgi:hypothetical protein
MFALFLCLHLERTDTKISYAQHQQDWIWNQSLAYTNPYASMFMPPPLMPHTGPLFMNQFGMPQIASQVPLTQLPPPQPQGIASSAAATSYGTTLSVPDNQGATAGETRLSQTEE